MYDSRHLSVFDFVILSAEVVTDPLKLLEVDGCEPRTLLVYVCEAFIR